jgi:hypothetical protein
MKRRSFSLWMAAPVMIVAAAYGVYLAPGSKLVASTVSAYPGLVLAMAAGLFGATFSMLVQIQQRTSQGTLDDIQSAASWHSLIVRCSFGLGAAAILYFFFESGLLEGSLWPSIDNLEFVESKTGNLQRVPNKDWCLLVIWSFLAGFSENFVPTILIRTEAKEQKS